MTPLDPRILALLQAGDLTAAARMADAAIAAGASHPLLFDARAHLALQEGRHLDALSDFTRALALAPGNPSLHVSAARSLIPLGRFDEALDACNRAIAVAPDMAAAHFEKGCAAEFLGDLHLARREFQQTAALDPRAAEAPARLAALAARRGDWSEAGALARKSLSRDPANISATLSLATAAIGAGEAGPQIERLEGLLQRHDLSAEARCEALALRADILDRQDRFAEAFEGYAAANAVLARAYAPRFAGLPAGTQRVARLLAEFTAVPAERWAAIAAGPSPAAGHVFVLGFYRTGTTLLGQILASHPAVVTLEEKPLLVEAAAEFLEPPGGLARLADLTAEDASHYRDLYWRHVRKNEPGIAGKIVVDKLPLNSLALPVIARLFPEAKIVFAVRDPRDVVFSCFRRLLNVNRDTFEMLSLERGAAFYAAVMDLAAAYRARLPLAALDVRNEDVAADFEPQVKRICAFLGLGWKDSMARFGEASRARSIATPSAAQVARGISSDGVGQWRRYAAELAGILPALARWTGRFGYPAA
ncbi:MAG: tetratricopeptide repeat-containing sulfotransferase family protein [Rhizomicrobium sp.]